MRSVVDFEILKGFLMQTPATGHVDTNPMVIKYKSAFLIQLLTSGQNRWMKLWTRYLILASSNLCLELEAHNAIHC